MGVNVDSQVQRHHVSVAVIGTPWEMFYDALDNYREELAEREHLSGVDVRWDNDRQAVVIDIDQWDDWTPQELAQHFAEEVSEITVAVVVGDWEGFRVTILQPE